MNISRLSTLLLAAGFLAACATSKSVDEKIAAAQAENAQKIESVTTQIEQVQQKQRETDTRLEQLSQEARDALKRAEEAGILAKGKVAFEQSFSEDRVKFKVDGYEISPDAKAALDEFAGRLKALQEPYFLEIQGHTDNSGPSEYNEELGQRRADAVRRYLSREHQIPLNRMSTISYGETLPATANKTRAGRSQNRRVVLVVLV